MLSSISELSWFFETFENAESYMIKDVPNPSPLLSTLTDPPIFSIIGLHILNPSPVPLLFKPWESASLLKLWNNLPIFSFEIPVPESFTTISYEI